MERKKIRIGISGFGNIGQAIFEHLKKNQSFSFFIYSRRVMQVRNARCVKNFEELAGNSDLVFLCVKPQDFSNIYRTNITNRNKIFISVMAGVKIKKISGILGSKKIIRTMPNLNISVGQAVTGYYADKKSFTIEELGAIEKIINNFGCTIRVKNEDDLNAITAISGSGPAYVFLFINALVKSAINLGFSEKISRQIVMKTIAGSVKHLEKIKNPDLEELMIKVRSRGGTTEAAFKSLNVNNFYSAWKEAAKAAQKRAEELSNER